MTLERRDVPQEPQPIGEEVMKGLKAHIGQTVTVQHVWYGILRTETSKLRNVTNFTNIEIEGSGIPFVGNGSAIRIIVGQGGEILYDNPLIPDDYDRRRPDEIDEMVRLTFGEEVVQEKIRAREEYERDWQERQARLNKEAQSKSANLIEEGEQLVKPDLKDEWREYAQNNTQDFYSSAVVDVSIKVAKALSEGKSPGEAAKAMYEDDITGFQAGCVAQSVTHFHPRGEEFRKWWNREHMSEQEAEEAKGVVNPAILTISPKDLPQG